MKLGHDTLIFAAMLDHDGDLEVEVDCDCQLTRWLPTSELKELRDMLNELLKEEA